MSADPCLLVRITDLYDSRTCMSSIGSKKPWSHLLRKQGFRGKNTVLLQATVMLLERDRS